MLLILYLTCNFLFGSFELNNIYMCLGLCESAGKSEGKKSTKDFVYPLNKRK